MDERIYKKYFIGKFAPGFWASVYAYKPHSHEIKIRRGEIFAVITLSGPETFAVNTAGNLLLDNFHETYFEDATDNALAALEKATKGASGYLQKLLENDSAADVGIDFNFGAMAILGDIVYFVAMGNAILKIWRDGKLTDISPILKDPDDEGLVKVGSMISKQGDIFFLTTNEFEKEVSEEGFSDLAQTFSDQPLKQRMFEDESKIAMIMVGYNIDFDSLKKSTAILSETTAVDTKEEIADSVQDEVVEQTPGELESPAETDDVEEGHSRWFKPVEQEKSVDEVENEQPDDDFITNEENLDFEEDVAAPSLPTVPMPPVLKPKRNINLAPKIKGAFGAIGGIFSGVFKKKQKVQKEQDGPATQSVNQSGEIEDDEFIKNDTEESEGTTIGSGVKSSINSKPIEEKPSFFYYFAKIGTGLKSFGRLIWEDWLGMGKNSANLHGPNKNRRWGFLFIILVVLGAMIYFSVNDALKNQNEKTVDINAQKYITEASDNLNRIETDAKVIAKSNLTLDRKQQFIDQLSQVQQTLNSAKGISAVADSLKVQEDRILAITDLINKTVAVINPTIITDIGARNPGAILSDIAINPKTQTIFYADQKYGKIYSNSYNGKSEKEIATGLTSPFALTYDTTGYLVFLDRSSDRMMGVINLKDDTIERVAGTSSTNLGGVTRIDFVLMNSKTNQKRIYAIDPATKSVYYMESTTGSNYGFPVKKNITADGLDQAKDIAIIDGKIYLLMPYNQGIYRSYSDKNDTPVITGLDTNENFTRASALYIDDQYIYIGDSSTKIVYVIDKNSAALKAKYVYRGSDLYFGNIVDIVADRTLGKIFVLDGSRVLLLSMSDLSNF